MKTSKCSNCGMNHSLGALVAARVIMNGENVVKTEYGRKTVCGIADLIDTSTAAPDLLAALQSCIERMAELQKHTNYPLAWPRVQAMEAIRKAKGDAK